MAVSYGATFISTAAIVGFGGVAGLFGMSLLWLTFLNIGVGILIAFIVLGEPTRRLGHHLGAHTFPELLGLRYQSRGIQIFTGAIIFLFMPLYAAAVMTGGAASSRRPSSASTSRSRCSSSRSSRRPTSSLAGSRR